MMPSMTTPTPRSRDDLARQDAAADHLTRLLDADRWVVACTYISGGRARISAVNDYDDLNKALAALTEVSAELEDHQHATLMPLGPVTEAEMVRAGIISAGRQP